MENLDLFILTSIIATLFLVFIIVVYKEFKNVSDLPDYSAETGPRANMVRFIGRLFEEGSKPLNSLQKKELYTSVKRTISDMESDGVYFSEEAKRILEEKRKELECEYSGLPSVKSYED